MSQFKRFNSSDNTNWNTGDAYPAGTLTWDMDNGLRLHDGNTSGGNSVGGSSFSGSYTDLTDKPSLATVATSGNYYDLSNTPTLFSGEYNALTGKPTLFSGDYDDLTDKPTIRIAVATGSGPGGNNQADSLALAGLNPVTDIPSTWGGDLILQGGVGGANGDLYGEVRIKSGQIGANYEWHFTTDKKIKLPAGGDIVDSTGASVLGATGPQGPQGETGPQGPAGASGNNTPTFSVQNSDFGAVAGTYYAVDTTAGQVTAILPANPSIGQSVHFVDAAGFWPSNRIRIITYDDTVQTLIYSSVYGNGTTYPVFQFAGVLIGFFWTGTAWRRWA
jgi:hypothetical protein